ncbi:MAG TPA: ABC transporter ATP-binding protein [Spongiibacteraceae bacterium]|nr:ABC transporter ATP-binding protein [Spongiibacteraceae bacterium]
MGTIRVHNLGKAYRQYSNRWARLAEWLSPTKKIRHVQRWVLHDINFEVNAGESIGIVGINGAGKSTLLKIITGTTQPTTGSLEIKGTVAALLELGMGFHPDFTGRQNVFMAGQLIGLTHNEIITLLPEIQAFAGIGDYFDQPLRIYSSGMQMRLAFSLATARRPDILIVDEALSVGDSFFKHKSFARIREFREQGTTLLIVSHDRNAIQTICDRAILLHGGSIVRQGPPEEVMDFYNALMAETELQTVRQITQRDGSVQTISGTGEAVIDSIDLLNSANAPVETVEVGAEVTFRVRVGIRQSVPRLALGYMIKDHLGQPIYGINTHRLGQALENLAAGEHIVYHIRFPVNLGKGTYSIALSLSCFDSHLDKNYEWRDRCLLFHVVNVRREDFVGCAWLNAKIDIERPGINSTLLDHSAK